MALYRASDVSAVDWGISKTRKKNCRNFSQWWESLKSAPVYVISIFSDLMAFTGKLAEQSVAYTHQFY